MTGTDGRTLVVTPTGIGDARLGMTLDEVRAATAPLGPLQPCPGTDPRWATDGPVHLSLELDADGRVESLEVADPWDPDDPQAWRVVFDDIPLFDEPADAVVAALRERVGGDLEENGFTFTAPTVLLALWRDANGRNDQYEDDDEWALPRHWTAALVARPGYDER